MISLGVKNFRNLKNTGRIQIKPLNILLGANSSGKSSFLRIFPLLRQSIEVTTKGPLLWYGDYVDFGDFETVVRKGEKEIIFQTEHILRERTNAYGISWYHRDLNIKLDIHVRELKDSTYVETIKIAFENQKIVIIYSKENKIRSIEINDYDILKGNESLGSYQRKGGIIPIIIKQAISAQKTFSFVPDDNFKQVLFSFIGNRLRRGTSSSSMMQIVNIGLGSKEDILSQIRKPELPITWLSNTKNWTIDDKEFEEFNNLLLGTRLSNLIDALNEVIIRDFEDFYYIAPLRAIAERYYRRQNLSVSEVDFQGKNLPMYISNMTPQVLLKFQEWVEIFFKYYPETTSFEGHISLKLIDRKTGENFNIADRGFGYSQLLPIITMIWSIINNSKQKIRRYQNSDKRCVVIAIEQPELHLHPSLQARMVDVFMNSIELAKEKGILLNFVIETHSETMINYIGNKIYKKDFNEDDINVLVFGKNEESKNDIVSTNYDNNGHLSIWPYGFFDPEY